MLLYTHVVADDDIYGLYNILNTLSDVPKNVDIDIDIDFDSLVTINEVATKNMNGLLVLLVMYVCYNIKYIINDQ